MDNINYFISRWNIGQAQKKSFIQLRKTKQILEIIQKFYFCGFINGYEIQKNNHILVWGFKSNIKLVQISKPGNRVYCSFKELQKFKVSYFIFSSFGILSQYEVPTYRTGGELIFKIYT